MSFSLNWCKSELLEIMKTIVATTILLVFLLFNSCTNQDLDKQVPINMDDIGLFFNIKKQESYFMIFFDNDDPVFRTLYSIAIDSSDLNVGKTFKVGNMQYLILWNPGGIHLSLFFKEKNKLLNYIYPLSRYSDSIFIKKVNNNLSIIIQFSTSFDYNSNNDRNDILIYFLGSKGIYPNCLRFKDTANFLGVSESRDSFYVQTHYKYIKIAKNPMNRKQTVDYLIFQIEGDLIEFDNFIVDQH
jgi:hypothetical protein